MPSELPEPTEDDELKKTIGWLMRQNSAPAPKNRQLRRQDSRLATEEKTFYRSCSFLMIVLCICWCLTLILYILSIYKNEGVLQLLALNIIIDLLGVICVLLFFKKDWLKKCKRNRPENLNREVNTTEMQPLHQNNGNENGENVIQNGNVRHYGFQIDN